MPIARRLACVLPGIVLCAAISLAGYALQRAEEQAFGRAPLEALVLAILIGATLRAFWAPGPRFLPGIRTSAKFLLEVAVLLLGASVSAASLAAIGLPLLLGIAATVALAIAASYGLGRLLGLPSRMALLVACGNSICGNSAIAAVAPVIGADGEDISASIGFTAVMGVGVVLGLPLLLAPLHLSLPQYGVLAGLTIYAVPQVLAATAPVGTVALQLGTLVKLVRVMMLGPVVLTLSTLTARLREETDEPAPHLTAGGRPAPGRIAVHRLVPWFILGFLGLAALRTAGLVPHTVLAPTAWLSTALTIVSMAALGVETDIRRVAAAGPRVTAAVVGSLLLLGAISLLLIRVLSIG
jgi:uncharacterized integral membrane protein (TIGR00698 family)